MTCLLYLLSIVYRTACPLSTLTPFMSRMKMFNFKHSITKPTLIFTFTFTHILLLFLFTFQSKWAIPIRAPSSGTNNGSR